MSSISKQFARSFKGLAVSVGAMALTACGGGGVDSVASPSAAAPATVNILAAYKNLVTQPHSYQLQGTNSQGTKFTATMNFAKNAQVTNGGVTYDSASVTISVYDTTGTLLGTGVTTAWQDVGTPDWAMAFNSADNTCLFRTGGSPLPTSAAIGSSGPYLSGTQYAGCSPSNLPQSWWASDGTEADTWSYSVISGTPFVCVNSSLAGAVGTSTESDCIEVVDSSGTLGAHVRVTVKDLNNVTTTLTN